jgi:ethanolamine utilization protein EutN
MRIAEVIGNVTLSRWHPSLTGARRLLAVPLDADGLRKPGAGQRGEALVTYDELSARAGSLIGLSEGAEASAPFHPNVKPIDTYNAAIFDQIEIE